MAEQSNSGTGNRTRLDDAARENGSFRLPDGRTVIVSHGMEVSQLHYQIEDG